MALVSSFIVMAKYKVNGENAAAAVTERDKKLFKPGGLLLSQLIVQHLIL